MRPSAKKVQVEKKRFPGINEIICTPTVRACEEPEKKQRKQQDERKTSNPESLAPGGSKQMLLRERSRKARQIIGFSNVKSLATLTRSISVEIQVHWDRER